MNEGKKKKKLMSTVKQLTGTCFKKIIIIKWKVSIYKK